MLDTYARLLSLMFIGAAYLWSYLRSRAEPYEILCRCNAYFKVHPPCLVRCPDCGIWQLQLPRSYK